MAKKAATYRLEAESLEWVSSYAEERSKADGRKVSQADVIEMGIAALRQDAEGGVPDLTVSEPVPTPSAAPRFVDVSSPVGRDEIRQAEQEYRAAAWARQAKLNESKGRASR